MSDLKPTKPLSGFVELLPTQQRCFDECAARMQKTLKTAGFSHLDLPAIERAEVLTDKDNWEEIETQMFLFQKGETKMGLRYDGTVGLARYVAGNINDLVFPFRAYQFARNYRGERPQRGRYREFYQMDLDILGINELSLAYDAEIVAVLSKTYESCANIIGKTYVKVGNRRFWNAMFEWLGLDEEQARAAFTLIDKKDKIGEEFPGALREKIGNLANEILRVFSDGYEEFSTKSANLMSAVEEINSFIATLNAAGIENATIDLAIMRGHAYYTGIVFEFFSESFPELGAIGGGGRYENLASKFSKTKIVGVGAAVGFSRLMVALLEDNKIDLTRFETPIDAAVLVMGEGQLSFAMGVCTELRKSEIVTTSYLDVYKKFKNQIEFADKIKAKFSIIIGEDEAKDKIVALKNMTTGTQEKLTTQEAIKRIKA